MAPLARPRSRGRDRVASWRGITRADLWSSPAVPLMLGVGPLAYLNVSAKSKLKLRAKSMPRDIDSEISNINEYSREYRVSYDVRIVPVWK